MPTPLPAFQIEKDTPLPASTRKYPFPDMEVGDSLTGPKVMATSAHAWGRVNGVKFITRTQPDGTVRIWRTA